MRYPFFRTTTRFRLSVFSTIVGVLGVFLSGCASNKYIEGIVVDYQTLEPIADVEVSVNQVGWGFSDGSLIRDKSYVFGTRSDDDGTFRIEYDVGSSAYAKVSKEGFVSYNAWYAKNSVITIKLKKKNPNYTSLPHGFLEIGIKDFKPYGWMFSEERVTLDLAEADVFPKFDEKFSRENIRIETCGRGGIAYVSKQELGVESGYLVYSDLAPAEGYVPALNLLSISMNKEESIL